MVTRRDQHLPTKGLKRVEKRTVLEEGFCLAVSDESIVKHLVVEAARGELMLCQLFAMRSRWKTMDLDLMQRRIDQRSQKEVVTARGKLKVVESHVE